MDKSFEEQTKIVNKAIIALKKQVTLPYPILAVFRDFLNYVYAIGYYKGSKQEIRYNMPVVMKRRGEIIETFKNTKEAARFTGFNKRTIEKNIQGNQKEVEGFQFRYVRKGNHLKLPSFLS